jgi:Uncharacterized protein conserved in bacteria
MTTGRTAAAPIRLITRADDAGSNHTANAAIRECLEIGFLKNVSVMAVGFAVEEAAEMLAGFPGVCFGLHTCVNAEWDAVRWGPVLPPDLVPTLVDDQGHFFKTTKALHENAPSEEQVFAELEAQLARLRGLGFDLKYADMHMGWGWVIPGFDARFDAWCTRHGLFHNRHRHRGLPEVAGESGDPVARFVARLTAAEPGQYAVVGHPAYDNEEMRALGHAGYPGEVVASGREWERRLFADPRVLDLWRSGRVEPLRYDEAAEL